MNTAPWLSSGRNLLDALLSLVSRLSDFIALGLVAASRRYQKKPKANRQVQKQV